MEHDGFYRFSLQFKKDNPANVLVGDFLSRLRHKKSQVVIEAVYQYLEANPALLEDKIPATVPVESPASGSLATLEKKLMAYIDEKLSGIEIPASDESTVKEEMSEDLAGMLAGIDAFDMM